MWHTCGFRKPVRGCENTRTKSTFMPPLHHHLPTHPPGRGVAADNDLCFPGTKCSLCPSEPPFPLHPPRFNGGDWPCSAQHGSPLRVINHRVKRWSSASPTPSLLEVERGGRPTGTPGSPNDAPGQHPSVANEKSGVEKSHHPSHLVYIKAEPGPMAPAAGVSDGFDGGSVSCGVGVRAVPGGVCGQRADWESRRGGDRDEGRVSRQEAPPSSQCLAMYLFTVRSSCFHFYSSIDFSLAISG
ncbi:uncharacterized protein AKAME5_000321700 [Lates japonicus]|uniref:Uncharacterized protein n=1 Tax=Lates japonicus TaxID=270547 RepID=A0AAD3QXB0_LATJO|nr:uncharacterized protein AKAME5_000321700 [Lates japonicus]